MNQERERAMNQERERAMNQERERAMNQERERAMNQSLFSPRTKADPGRATSRSSDGLRGPSDSARTIL